jgi:hypothetical protein
MARVVVTTLLVSLLAAPMAAAGQTAATSMKVFVTAGRLLDFGEVTDAERQEYDGAIRAAQVARRDLDKALKAQHGSKRDRWPVEAMRQLQEADDRMTLATSNWTYRSLRRRDPKRPLSVDDSVDDIKESMMGKGLASTRSHIVVVSSQAEAELVIEIEGRRLTGSWSDPTSSERMIRVAIARGAALSEAQFAAVPFLFQGRSPGYKTTRISGPSAALPQWRFEVTGALAFSAAAKGVAGLVDDFIATHYDAMNAEKREPAAASVVLRRVSFERRAPASSQAVPQPRRDSLWNGTLIGAGLGALLGALGGAAVLECSECSGFNVPLTFGVLGAGAGAAIGAGIDAARHNRSTAWTAPRGRRVAVAPVLHERTRALVAFVQF